MHARVGKMFIEELDSAERSFEEFQLEQVNFDLFYIESPDLLVALVDALLADAFTNMIASPYPCLTYDYPTDLSLSLCKKSDVQFEAELLWFDNYSRLQLALQQRSFFKIPKFICNHYPQITFASRNKALMIGAPQLEDLDDACNPVHVNTRDAEESWVSVPSNTGVDVSGWQLII